MEKLEKKKSKTLEKIQANLNKVNNDLDNMENSTDADTIYDYHESIINSIHKIIKEYVRLNDIENLEEKKNDKIIQKDIKLWASNEDKILKKIDKELVNFYKQIQIITGDSNRIKKHYAQKKLLIDLKSIMFEAQKYFNI